MRDMTLNSGHGWPFFFEDGGMSGMPNDSISWMNDSDGKLLRQTILRHEEIFRKQVCELHRLYRVQKLCMDEQSRRGEKSLPLNFLSSSPVPLENCFPFKEDHHITSTSSKSDPSARKTDNSPTNSASTQRKLNNTPKKVFDLHLPAEAYIDEADDDDDDEQFVKEEDFVEKKIITEAEFNENVQVRQPCYFLADLNEPVQEFDEKDEHSSSLHEIHGEDLQKHVPCDFKANDLDFFLGSQSNPIQAQDSSSILELRTCCDQIRGLRDLDLNLQPDEIFIPIKENHQNQGFEQDHEKLERDRDCESEQMAVEAIQAMAAAAKEEAARAALTWLAETVTCTNPFEPAALSLHTVRMGPAAKETTVAAVAETVTCVDPFELEALSLESVEVTQVDREATTSTATAVEDETSGRRRRRRCNFRRDVLPGLGTLTRQEVLEDIQFLTAMTRMCGERKRGGRGIGGRRELLGWGRTTRRCWRQRCLPGSLATEMVVAMDG